MSIDIFNFKCPITKQIYYDPVLAEDGNIYERELIEEWLKTILMSPLTFKKIGTKLVSSISLKRDIKNILTNYPGLKEDQWSPSINHQNDDENDNNENNYRSRYFNRYFQDYDFDENNTPEIDHENNNHEEENDGNENNENENHNPEIDHENNNHEEENDGNENNKNENNYNSYEDVNNFYGCGYYYETYNGRTGRYHYHCCGTDFECWQLCLLFWVCFMLIFIIFVVCLVFGLMFLLFDIFRNLGLM